MFSNFKSTASGHLGDRIDYAGGSAAASSVNGV